jgi:hypothetical protein
MPIQLESDSPVVDTVGVPAEAQGGCSSGYTPDKPSICQEDPTKKPVHAKANNQTEDRDFDYPYLLPTNFIEDIEVDLA